MGIRHRWRMSLGTVILSVLMSVALVACGSSSDGTDNGSSQSTGSSSEGGGSDAQAVAQKSIDTATAVPKFTLKAPSVEARKAAGKSIFNIPLSTAVPAVNLIDGQMEEIANEVGVEFTEYQNQGSPTEWASGIEQAILRKADLIMLSYGSDPKKLVPQLKRAKEAGIPVLVASLYQTGSELPPEVADLITATRTEPFAEAGALTIDYAVAQDGCEGVDAIILTVDGNAAAEAMDPAIQDRFKKLCPDAKEIPAINIPIAEWGTKTQGEVQSALQADPGINWILPNFDAMALGAVAGVRAAGKTDSVKVASYNGTPEVLALIQSGDIMAADVGESNNWLGYANMDQAFRILTGAEPIASGDEENHLRLFDDSNVAEAGTPPNAQDGYGDAYVSGYRKLWGLK